MNFLNNGAIRQMGKIVVTTKEGARHESAVFI
jgi:hypothetical protein